MSTPITTVQPWYCTREDVKAALDVAETARSNRQIDREIAASSRGIEGDLLRYFYPSESTETFDWPDHQFSAPWRLWLDARELTSVTAITTAGTDITASCLLRPDDAPLRGRPYTHIEIDLSTSAAWNSGATYQRSISVTGTFGFCAGEDPAGTISGLDTTTGTTGTVSDGSLVGVGSILRVDTERMIVTGRAMATTGQTLTADVAVSKADTLIPVGDGTQIGVDEVLLVDGERMLVTDIAGDNLIVERAWDGSVLAAHTTGAAVYASRLLTVRRGALGTTAASHADGSVLAVHVVPDLIRTLCVAETLATLLQERRGYSQIVKRSTSSGTASPGDPLEVSTALDDLRRRARAQYARLRLRTPARPI